jgi:ribonuclease HI
MITIQRPDLDWSKVTSVYSDGGVIGKNPSNIGGTWAFCYVGELGARIHGQAGTVAPDLVGLPTITNNMTELLALLLAIEQLPAGWAGDLYTDSLITLRRFHRPRRAKFAGIPDVIRDRVIAAVERLGQLTLHLLNGHPTKDELAAGISKRGCPVSVHNVWCDKACGEAAKAFTA